MKSVSASHLQYNRWNSLLPKGLAKLWIFNFNISMNIMNCFSKTKFSLLFHPIFLSFACMMFHFRNSKFLNETGNSNKTSNFPNIFFQFRFFCFALGVPGGLCFCVSHEGCEPRSSNAAILGMPGSIQTTSKQHPHPTSKPQKKHPPLWSQTTSVSHVQLLLWKSWYSKQSSGWSFPDQFTAVSEASMKFGAPISDRQKPRNGMIQFQKWLVQRWITWWSQLSHISHPHVVCWAHLTPSTVKLHFLEWSLFDTTKLLHCVTWVGSPFTWVNSKFWWAKTRRLTRLTAPVSRCIILYSLCPNLTVLIQFYSYYLLV